MATAKSTRKKPIIQLDHVTQSFAGAEGEIQVIKQANLEIGENTLNIVYGPSGSGKSTLLNILSGLQQPSTGTVEVEGRNLYELTADELAYFRANRIGIVYQTNYWVSSLSVVENVALPLNFLGYGRHTAEKLAMTTLERVGMEQYAHKNPMLLSGGEQQRVAMARALASTLLFIIADEPTGNLDVENGDKIIELLENCKTEFRCTIVLVTHNIEYLPVADDIFHINNGFVEHGAEGDVVAATNQVLNELQARLAKMRRVKK